MTGLVFNPDDEEDCFLFNAVEYKLAPEMATEVPDEVIARHAEKVLGRWGVRALSGDLDNDEQIRNEAREAYKVATRSWAEEVVLLGHMKNSPLQAAGLRVEDTPAVVKAKGWLVKHGYLDKV